MSQKSAVDQCIRCGENIREHGGGVQTEPGRFTCWDCELPDEDLCEKAEQRLAAEAGAEARALSTVTLHDPGACADADEVGGL